MGPFYYDSKTKIFADCGVGSNGIGYAEPASGCGSGGIIEDGYCRVYFCACAA